MVKRYVMNRTHGEELRLEQLMDHLRQEVQYVREEQPDLSDFQLYDLTFSFLENGMLLQMEFRK
ncbi:MAG: hypothetical protein ACXVDJ_03425 [Tumebacillaceae bacterium]